MIEKTTERNLYCLNWEHDWCNRFRCYWI